MQSKKRKNISLGIYFKDKNKNRGFVEIDIIFFFNGWYDLITI